MDSRWGLALMVVTGACAVASSGCLRHLYEKDCLEFAALELGDVSPSSRRRLELPLLNCGRRTIAAIDARANCGCVRHAEPRFELLPGHRHTRAFEFVAPATPGPFEKRIVLASGSQQWTVPLRGVVQDILRAEVISIGPVNAAPNGLTLDLLIIGAGAGTATVSPQVDWVVIQESQVTHNRA